MSKEPVHSPHLAVSNPVVISLDAYRNRKLRDGRPDSPELVVPQPLMSRPQRDADVRLDTHQGEGVDDGGAIEEILDGAGVDAEFVGEAADGAGAPDLSDADDVTEIEGELSQGLVDGIVDPVIGPGVGDVLGAETALPATVRGHAPEIIETPCALRETHEGVYSQGVAPETTAVSAGEMTPAERAIHHWTPRSLPEAEWMVIRPLTVELVDWLRVEHGWGYKAIVSTRLAVARFLHRCHVYLGLELKPDLLQPDLIDNYLATFNGAPATVETERKRLYYLSQQLNPHCWEKVGPRQRQYNEPYSAAEVTGYIEWAQSQYTKHRRHYAQMAIALAAGAGLRLREIEAAQARDVHHSDGSVFINAGRLRGGPEVLVQVEPRFAELVFRAAQGVPPETLIARAGRVRVTQFLKRGDKLRTGSPKTMRLRNYWITARLREGMPEEEVARLAGLSEVRSYRTWVASTKF